MSTFTQKKQPKILQQLHNFGTKLLSFLFTYRCLRWSPRWCRVPSADLAAFLRSSHRVMWCWCLGEERERSNSCHWKGEDCNHCFYYWPTTDRPSTIVTLRAKCFHEFCDYIDPSAQICPLKQGTPSSHSFYSKRNSLHCFFLPSKPYIDSMLIQVHVNLCVCVLIHLSVSVCVCMCACICTCMMSWTSPRG